MEYEFWFCPNDIKHCVNGSKKKYMLDWPIIFNTWHVKIGTNLSRQEVLALEGARFQLQQREVLSPCRRLFTIAALQIPQTDFHASLRLDAHPTSRFGKKVRHNLEAPTA